MKWTPTREELKTARLNAERLNAAAPDLLAALVRLVNEMQVASSRGRPIKPEWLDLRIATAREAIKKATGE